MANQAHSQIQVATVIDGIPMIKWVHPASTYKPADWVYLTAAITATHLDHATPICRYHKPFQLEFKPRVTSAMARKDCDDPFAATDIVPMIMGGRKGAITTIAKITDPGGTKFAGYAFMASTTAGDITLCNTSTAASGGSMNQYIMNAFNPETLVSTDTYAKLTWI